MQRIMIIEDDAAIRDELSLLLTNEGYHPLPVTDFMDIPTQAVNSRPDLILLDIGLPGHDGFSLCASLRKSVNTPIIFVTSRDSGLDEIRALSLGGDDYISKPYNVPVLLARIKAVLRRGSKETEPDEIVVNGLHLHLTKGTISTQTKTTTLTRNELQILANLMAHAGEIVSRSDLIEALWDSQIYIDDNTLSVNVTRLRGELGTRSKDAPYCGGVALPQHRTENTVEAFTGACADWGTGRARSVLRACGKSRKRFPHSRAESCTNRGVCN